MQIGVSGIFQFSEIFGGKLDLTTTCNLAFFGSYSLIYAEMTHLDVIAVLNEAFDLGLGGQSLIVDSAGFFTFSAGNGGSSQATLQSIFPNSPVPATVSDTATPVTNTTSFWLTVELVDTGGDSDNDGLFISLVDIGVASGTQLSLSATFASGMDAGTAIKNADYALSLDGQVELFGIFTFQNVVINYSIADSTQLSIGGTLDVSLFGSNFTFTGTVSSDSGTQSVTADIAAVGNVNLDSLFGGAFTGISFSNIAFNLYYPYGSNTDTAQFMVRGGCDFAGLEFTGLLYMEGMTPVLGSVVFTQSASINTLFEQCIPGASWPDTLVDLVLLSGCQVYYNSTTAPLTLTLSNDGTGPTLLPPPPGTGTNTGGTGSSNLVPSSPTVVTYTAGFNLAASFILTLLDSFDVAGTIVVNGDGVTASIGISDPIDIYVLQITKQGDATRGPVLSISTEGNSGTMSFMGG